MIAKERHNETTPDGRFIYVIEMPERCTSHPHPELEKRMFKVKFWNGIGKTVHREKAQIFDEQYNYIVHLHKKDKPWLNASIDKANTMVVLEEDHFEIDDNDEGIEEE